MFKHNDQTLAVRVTTVLATGAIPPNGHAYVLFDSRTVAVAELIKAKVRAELNKAIASDKPEVVCSLQALVPGAITLAFTPGVKLYPDEVDLIEQGTIRAFLEGLWYITLDGVVLSNRNPDGTLLTHHKILDLQVTLGPHSRVHFHQAPIPIETGHTKEETYVLEALAALLLPDEGDEPNRADSAAGYLVDRVWRVEVDRYPGALEVTLDHGSRFKITVEQLPGA